MKEKIKNMKGITLMALVVTIIILIILAGISISMLVGENGLITIAKQSKQNIELAQAEEQDKLNRLYGELQIATNESGQVTLNMSDLNSVIDSRINSAKQGIKDEAKLEIYPVGSVYISVDSTNPSTLFGGTWQQIAQGKTLVGIDTNDTDFDTVEETGGEKTHTLTESEMPSHTHNLYSFIFSGNAAFGTMYGLHYDSIKGSWSVQNSRTSYGPYNASAGGSQAHNNLQPYVVTYMWKRTA